MKIRNAIGNREIAGPPPPRYHRGPRLLWPHACFACRKSWKLVDGSSARCPQCGGELGWMGRAFKPPKTSDQSQWAKVEALWQAGFRFPSHERWRDAEPYPETHREVAEFIQRNPDHPFRIKV